MYIYNYVKDNVETSQLYLIKNKTQTWKGIWINHVGGACDQ